MLRPGRVVMISKDKIVKQLRGMLEHEPRIDLHHHRIGIDVDAEGSIIVDGEVADVAAKKRCLELAASIPDTSGIIDRLRVTPAERMGDGEIRDRVRDALVEEPAFERYDIRSRPAEGAELIRETAASSGVTIEFAVNEGVVTLDGVVKSLTHKRLAGVLAWWVRGTRDVINGLEVFPPQEDCDDDITEAIRLVLEKDPLVNAGLVRIKTRDAVVNFEGLVANDQERHAAETDAWCVFGVNQVVNRLEVRQ